MEQAGTYHIPTTCNEVWNALHNDKVLQSCIVGCESMCKVDLNTYKAVINQQLGPLRARFTVSILVRNLNPPISYILEVQANGGTAGFGKGTADVILTPNDQGGTTIQYKIMGAVGGKVVQLGSRLIKSVSQRIADDFFSQFAAQWPTNVDEEG